MLEDIKSAIDNAEQSTTINPLDYPSIKCDCGCETFVPGVVFKKIPGLLMGAGAEEQIVPIHVYVCSKCGELMPEYKKQTKQTSIIQ